MTSKKQIAANKRNAQKGGVKSEEGKEISKMNALKHGILSSQLYITTGSDIGSYKDFLELKVMFFEELQPEGLVEILLVDRLFSAYWRLKRLHIAETGFIEKQQATHFMKSMFDKMEKYGTARTDAEKTFYQRIRTREGCSHMESFWQAIYENLQEKGPPLTDNMISNVRYELGGGSGFFRVEAFCILNRVLRNKATEKLTEEEEKRMAESMLSTAKDMYEMFKALTEVLESDEEQERSADRKAKMIPPLQEMEHIQRYDAHLQRVMFQTLHELQRVQSTRLGRPAPLAAALDVTLDSENGFVS